MSGSAAKQTADRARRHDPLAPRVGLVVLLDVVEVVEVVHHQSVGLADAVVAAVAEPVEPLEPRAIAEMETRHGVLRQAAALLRAETIVGTRPHQPPPPR